MPSGKLAKRRLPNLCANCHSPIVPPQRFHFAKNDQHKPVHEDCEEAKAILNKKRGVKVVEQVAPPVVEAPQPLTDSEFRKALNQGLERADMVVSGGPGEDWVREVADLSPEPEPEPKKVTEAPPPAKKVEPERKGFKILEPKKAVEPPAPRVISRPSLPPNLAEVKFNWTPIGTGPLKVTSRETVHVAWTTTHRHSPKSHLAIVVGLDVAELFGWKKGTRMRLQKDIQNQAILVSSIKSQIGPLLSERTTETYEIKTVWDSLVENRKLQKVEWTDLGDNRMLLYGVEFPPKKEVQK